MDILAEAEAIVTGAATQHNDAQAHVMEAFRLSAEQADRAIFRYEQEIECMAATRRMTFGVFTARLPMHRAWGILGFYAGQILAYDDINDSSGE